MRKLSMALDDLCVETFVVAAAAPGRGTVQANALTTTASCVPTCGNPPAPTDAHDAITDPRMCCV